MYTREEGAKDLDASRERRGVAEVAALSAGGDRAAQLRDVDEDLVPAMTMVPWGPWAWQAQDPGRRL